MKRVLIAIVDAAHARLYTYQGENVQEQRDLVNAGRQAHGAFTTTVDHIAAMDVKFAKVVVDEVARLASEQGFRNVILVASPHMLGELRRASGPLHDFEVDE